MHNTQNDLLDQVQANGATPLRDWPADEVAAAHSGFFLQVLLRPTAFSVSSIKLISERASTATQELDEFRGRRHDAHSHWGLNE